MIDMVASLVGDSDDPEARNLALRYLDRAADRLNMRASYLYRMSQVTYEGLTEGQSLLELPIDWGWPIDPAVVYDSDGKYVGNLTWVTWDTFQKIQRDPTSTGCTQYLCIENSPAGYISMFPTVDSSGVSSIKLTHLARVQRVSESPTDLRMLPEIREAMVSIAEYLMMRHDRADNPAAYVQFKRDAEEMTQGAIAAGNRWIGAVGLTSAPGEIGSENYDITID